MAMDGDPETPVPSVCHYTRAATLLDVLKSECLWASDIRYLNDSREYAYTLDLARSMIAEKAKTADGAVKLLWQECQLVLMMKEYFAKASEFQPLPVRHFVTAFSGKLDDLSQWRAYGNPSGVAIHFQPATLRSMAEPLKASFQHCIYDEQEQRRVFGDWLEGLASDVRKLPTGLVGLFGHWKVAGRFFSGLDEYATSFKHPKFVDEDEWRLVVATSGIPGPTVRVRASGRMLVPYVEVPLTPSPFVEVMAGPSANENLARQSVRDALNAAGMSSTRATVTSVPHRGQW